MDWCIYIVLPSTGILHVTEKAVVTIVMEEIGRKLIGRSEFSSMGKNWNAIEKKDRK